MKRITGDDLDKDFIGKLYGKRGQIEVLKFLNYSRGKKDRIYEVKCHECSKDPEMFEEGLFKTHRTMILKNIEPCGCSTSVRYSEAQYVIIVKRICQKMGLTFMGFNGEFKRVFTRLELLCHECNNVWNSGTITNLKRGISCPYCAHVVGTSKRFGKEDTHFVKMFRETGKFPVGYDFVRVSPSNTNNKEDMWECYCPTCSVDEYVQAGLCSGKFLTHTETLKRGGKSCRCSNGFRWSKEQREYQINSKIKELNKNFEFVRWVEYKGFDSNTFYKCGIHGEWIGRLDTLVYNGSGCPSCSISGYDSSKSGSLYVLNVVGRKDSFTGYGISNVLDRRMKDHVRNLGDYGFTIEKKFVIKSDGKSIQMLEQQIKEEFPLNPQEVSGFKTEATYSYLYEDVVSFVKDNIQQVFNKQLDKPLTFN